MIQREINEAKKGAKAQIVAKMNALVDKELIDKLYEASQAGVEVKLIVRGICCLVPGVPGLSDRIHVISVVDRFLEHSRIYFFHAGGAREVYLSSADWMPRNMDRRVEVMFPVEDSDYREAIINNLLALYLADNVKARVLQPDGSYKRLSPGLSEPPVRCQQGFIEMARLQGIKSIPYEEAMKHDSIKEKGTRPVARGRRKGGPSPTDR
jgi:polyphosphate kinase